MTRLRVAFAWTLRCMSLRLRALIRCWRGVYVCKSRCTRTRFQFKKTLPGEHSSEHFWCVGTHVQAFMNLVEVFFLRCFSQARKKHFRRNFRKCSRMRAIDHNPSSTTARDSFKVKVSLLWHKRHTQQHTRRPRLQYIFPLHFSHPGLSFLQDPGSSG